MYKNLLRIKIVSKLYYFGEDFREELVDFRDERLELVDFLDERLELVDFLDERLDDDADDFGDGSGCTIGVDSIC